MKNPLPLEQVASDIDALMTGDAAERFEQLVTVQLFDRQRRGIAAEPAVEPAAWGQQRLLVGGNRIREARLLRSLPICLLESTYQLGIGTQPSQHLPDACSHDLRIFYDSLDLGLQSSEPAFPTEAKAQRRVENSGGIEENP